MEGLAHDTRTLDVELGKHVVGDLRRRGGRESKHGGPAQDLGRPTDSEIRGPEIVAPLRDAVRLVHHQQRGPQPIQFGEHRW